jgi:DNA-binding NarL/FixJ family response regulator
MRPTTVLIVDDDAAFRALARRRLALDGFEAVGEAAEGFAALRAACALHPDVVLLDVQLPGADGFEVTERLLRFGITTVVLTSVRDREDYGERLTLCGARGFVPKAALSGPTLRAAMGSAG